MFVGRRPNKSGSVSVQLVEKRDGRSVVVRSFGSSRDAAELRRLGAGARTALETLERQQSISFGRSDREQAAVELVKGAVVRSVGPALVLGKIEVPPAIRRI